MFLNKTKKTDSHIELSDERGEIRVFEVERENIFGESEVVKEVEALAINAPTDQVVGVHVVHQRPQLGHKRRDAATSSLVASVWGRRRHRCLVSFFY